MRWDWDNIQPRLATWRARTAEFFMAPAEAAVCWDVKVGWVPLIDAEAVHLAALQASQDEPGPARRAGR